MFTRFAGLSTTLLLSFNIIATAPDLHQAMFGWSLFGFASTFLIGAYNQRETVCNNATFAFGVYRLSDMALLTATAFATAAAASPPGLTSSTLQTAVSGGGVGWMETMDVMATLPPSHCESIVAGGLIAAAVLKSSQFPFSALFMRSMEGPTPASALGYAGLSAHVGVVLLASTMDLWYGVPAAYVLGAIGGFTAIQGALVARIRSDRKGALANATSATIGLIYVTLATGHGDLALLMSAGHASYRMIQILRAPNIISDSHDIRAGLGYRPWPREVPDSLYRLCWLLRRGENDFISSGMHLLHQSTSRLNNMQSHKQLSKAQQWAATAAVITLTGAPITPLYLYSETLVMELLLSHPCAAAALMASHFGVSMFAMRYLFLKVLSDKRFNQDGA